MKLHHLVVLLSITVFVTSCTTFNQQSISTENRSPSFTGPFSIEKTSSEKFEYNFDFKIEAASGQHATDLASSSPDGTIKLKDAVTVQVGKIDPVTLLPVLNSDNTPVMEVKVYPAGTILNPTLNPDDDILIPKNVTITYKRIANDQLYSGRFAYYGVAPRFTSDNLEMTASKMAHTLRVKAWVTTDLVKNYEFTLLSRFKGFYDAFSQPTMHFVPLKSLKKLADEQTSTDMKKWYKVVGFYEDTLLERAGLDIYTPTDDLTYKDTILTSLLRIFLNNNAITIPEGLALYNQYVTDPNLATTRESTSTELFKFHFADRFVTTTDAAKPDRIGYLTFVYPVANDKDGPFKLPSPGLRQFPLNVSIEARWWSNRWTDEFGGFPFLQITDDGVAFHGPISIANTGVTDTWYLKRDNVSHSCMRMDPSDLLELRALIPKNMLDLQFKKKTIPLIIQEWPDVTDIDNNGTLEVVDVAYYKMPDYVGHVNNPENWHPSAMNKTFWTEAFQPYVDKLPSKNTFQVITDKVIDPTTNVETSVNRGVFTGLPLYEIVKGETVIKDYYQETPIMTMPQRPTMIIQYREDNVFIKNGNNPNDSLGKYPPSYFNKL